MQIWALGRRAHPSVLEAEGRYPYVSASDVPLAGKDYVPRPLTVAGMLSSYSVMHDAERKHFQKSKSTLNYLLQPLSMQ
jgi:hypothetical protein